MGWILDKEIIGLISNWDLDVVLADDGDSMGLIRG